MYVDWQQHQHHQQHQQPVISHQSPQQVLNTPTSASTAADHTTSGSRQLVIVPANTPTQMHFSSALIVDWLLTVRLIHGLSLSQRVLNGSNTQNTRCRAAICSMWYLLYTVGQLQ